MLGKILPNQPAAYYKSPNLIVGKGNETDETDTMMLDDDEGYPIVQVQHILAVPVIPVQCELMRCEL